jgi:mandelate racemase
MVVEKLTLRSVTVRTVLLPLRRPVVSKVGLFDQWPMILIDLQTEEGIVGRSYLAPYLRQSIRYLVPAIKDLAAARTGKSIHPIDDFQSGHKSLNLVGYEGMSLIAVSGLDMAAGDAQKGGTTCRLAKFWAARSAPCRPTTARGLWLTRRRDARGRGAGAGR